MRPAEYGICRIFNVQGRPIGLGFAVDPTHVITCAHVVNDAMGRAKREPGRPGDQELRLDFPIGAYTNTVRSALVEGWLPDQPASFDSRDLALLRLSWPAPEHVAVLRFGSPRSADQVQMWGPQPDRPDGGHVPGVLRGEVIGGRLQIDTPAGNPFRVRRGFSGGPVWDVASQRVVGVLAACGQEDEAVDAYVLGPERIRGVWAAAFPSDSTDSVVERVLLAARHRPDLRDARIDVMTSAGLTYLRATVEIRIGQRTSGSSQLPIGIVEGELTRERTDAFLRDVVAGYRLGGLRTPAMIVHFGPIVGSALREWAEQQGIEILSFAEFQGDYDLRPFADRQYAELEADLNYPPAGYVEQRYYEPPGTRIRDDSLLDRLRRWLAEPEGHLIVVLAPFGHGKTFLLHELARRLHADPFVTPVLVQLREQEKTHGLNELLVGQLTRGGERRLDVDRLRYLLHEGRIALLFDGFDELTSRSEGYDAVAAHLATIVEAAAGRSKVVLTSRREHFLNDDNVLAALGDRIATVAGRRIVVISSFSGDQIEEFLTRRLGGDRAAAVRRKELLAATGLLGPASIPRMLDFIAGIPEAHLRAAISREAGASKAELFHRLLDWWITFEHRRLNPPGATPGPGQEQLWAAVTDLARRAWTAPSRELTRDDLQESAALLLQTADALAPLDLGQAIHMLGSATVLVRSANGRFQFADRSVHEWLVARDVAQRLGAGTAGAASIRGFSALQREFLAEFGARLPDEPGVKPDSGAEPLRTGSVPIRPAATIQESMPDHASAELRSDSVGSLEVAPGRALPQRSVGRRRWLVPSIAGLVLALIVGGTTYVLNRRDNDNREPSEPGALMPPVALLDSGGNAPTPAPQVTGYSRGGQIKVLADSLESMDPALASNNEDFAVMSLVYRTLTGYLPNPDGHHLVGDLATNAGESSQDGKRWTYRLRDGVTFDDGSPITARDVAYGIARSFAPDFDLGYNPLRQLLDPEGKYAGPSGATPVWPNGLSIEGTDTIIFTFTTPQPMLPYILTMPPNSPVKFAPAVDPRYSDKFVSTGPYMRHEWVANTTLKLKRNPNWREDSDPIRHAYPDSFLFEFGVDADTQRSRITANTGEESSVMMSSAPGPATAAMLEDNTVAARRKSQASFVVDVLFINVKRVADLKVRQALSGLINRDELIEATKSVTPAEPLTTILAPGITGWKNHTPYPKVSAGASVPKLKLCYSSSSASRKPLAEKLIAGYARVGVTLTASGMNTAALFQEVRNPDTSCDLTLAGWLPDHPDGSSVLPMIMDSAVLGDYSKFVNAAISDELRKLGEMGDRTAAGAEYTAMDENIQLNYAPVIPIRVQLACGISGSRVRNFQLHPFYSTPLLTSVYVAPT